MTGLSILAATFPMPQRLCTALKPLLDGRLRPGSRTASMQAIAPTQCPHMARRSLHSLHIGMVVR